MCASSKLKVGFIDLTFFEGKFAYFLTKIEQKVCISKNKCACAEINDIIGETMQKLANMVFAN